MPQPLRARRTPTALESIAIKSIAFCALPASASRHFHGPCSSEQPPLPRLQLPLKHTSSAPKGTATPLRPPGTPPPRPALPPAPPVGWLARSNWRQEQAPGPGPSRRAGPVPARPTALFALQHTPRCAPRHQNVQGSEVERTRNKSWQKSGVSTEVGGHYALLNVLPQVSRVSLG